MRFASITFIACAVLIASPDIAMGASTGSKGSAVGSKGTTGKANRQHPPRPRLRPPRRTRPPQPSAAPTSTNLTHDKCPTSVRSCSKQTKTTDYCCFEENGQYVLSQQWTKGLGTDDYFTIHGMWPNTCAGTLTPRSGCDNSRVYTDVKARIQKLKPALVTDMTKYWPSKGNPNDVFWNHEWKTHGTCVSTLRPQCYKSYTEDQDIVDYFTNAMNLHKKYDYAAALKKHSIVPDNTNLVKAADFKKAINTEHGVNVVLKCKTNPATKVSELNEDLNTYIAIQPGSRDTCPTQFLYFKK
ncbi:ribonuclease T2 [Linderina pennispora]|uniref:ribonuclease T2 n=1 Tax=Linderina pennispora TaxID=61395 RepID=A0A1Y1WP19_9FUNG|nr:ribonuclease T2 [Linderina pennispora]ORX75038.1 ribonuclease T2 [Linderina pennispora]